MTTPLSLDEVVRSAVWRHWMVRYEVGRGTWCDGCGRDIPEGMRKHLSDEIAAAVQSWIDTPPPVTEADVADILENGPTLGPEWLNPESKGTNE